MKVAKLYRFNEIVIEDIPKPKIGPREALVRVRVCGICSGDVMPWYIEKKAPLVLGHEIAGEIVEIGEEIREEIDLKKGDRVSVHHHAPCMSCFFCQRGDHVQCDTWRNSKIYPGGISEYIVLPEVILKHDTIKLPDGVTFEEGAMVEPVACVVKSLRRANIKRGDTVLVVGLGVMGIFHIMLAREYGAKKVIGTDMVQFRLDRALKAGADYVIDVSKEDVVERLKTITEGKMAQSVIVGPGSVKVIDESIKLLSRGGTLVIFTPTPPEQKLTISVNELYFNDMTITTSYSCGPIDTREALDLIKQKKINFDILITHRFSINETAKAYELTAKAQDSLKCIVIL